MSFAGRELYRDVSLFIASDSRIGLVGPNGSGKSTLFKLILQEQEADSGDVEVQRDLRIAHLPQTGIVLKERSVLAETLSVFGDLERVEKELSRLETELHGRSQDDARLPELLKRYSQLREERDHAGYAHETQAKKMLSDLGFTESDFDKPTSDSSGGFLVRVALAKLLLQEPDVLLLDEPTNYLDIKAIAWLQDYLKAFRGAYVLITHDRYLLDACVNRIWAIEKSSIVPYKGNYTGYVEAKAVSDSQLEKAAEVQQKEIVKMERFIEKFRARKDTARRVKSRMKTLEKMERIVLPETRKRIRIRFPEAATIYGQAIALKGVAQSYGAKRVLTGVELAIAGGERVALFGANGEGKTTLLRIINGDLQPTAGQVWRSEKIKIAFYRQGAEELLDPALNVIDEVQKDAEGFTLLDLRTILGAFLFTGDDIYKSVGVLSGGEKTRLALLKVLLRPSNLLLLDEPTNHLDIDSREVLEEAISDYQNTVIFSAHDRYMIDRLARKTVAVRNGHADVFPGNYTYATSAHRTPAARDQRPAPMQGPSRSAGRTQPDNSKPETRNSKLLGRPAPSTAGRVVPTAKPAVRKPEPVPDDPAEKTRREIAAREERARQLETEFNEARVRLDFTRAREIWAQRQEILDEITVLRNQS